MYSTRTLNRILSLILIVSLCLSCMLLISCGEKEVSQIDRAGEIISETDDTLTIIDQAGREVCVKKNPESIALCYRVIIRFLLSLDQGDKIKGIGKSETFLEEIQPSLKDCADVGKGVADIEALAKLNPDIFIHKASDVETLEAVQNLGIPAVAIDVETPESMITALDLLGKVCNAEDKAEELIEFYDSNMNGISELSIDIIDKKSAIVMGTSIGKVADNSMLQGIMLEAAGAINCAKDLKTTELWPTAGTEQIFAWDPDYIFITGGDTATYTAWDLYKDKSWSELKAVKNHHVYTIPARKDSWEFPGIVSILGIEYMMKTMYPDLISELDFNRSVDAFYQLSYRRKFSKKELGY